jgi:hypothetical protein
MNRRPATTALCLLATIHVIASTLTASGQDGPRKETRPGPLADLVHTGYTRLPLRHVAKDTLLLIEVASGKEKLTLFVDTGASASTITPKAAKRLKLATEPLPNPPDHLVIGQRKMERAVIENLTAGGLALPPYRVHVAELEGIFHPDDLATADGILGSDILTFHSAVIDYSVPCVYLIPPHKILWPKLRGEWELANTTSDGVTTEQRESAPFLVFHEEMGKVTQGRREASGDVKAVEQAKFHKVGMRTVIGLYPDPKTTDAPIPPFTVGILDVEGDMLRVCTANNLKGDESDLANLPKTFEAKKGSGHIVYTFKRVKPEKK